MGLKYYLEFIRLFMWENHGKEALTLYGDIKYRKLCSLYCMSLKLISIFANCLLNIYDKNRWTISKGKIVLQVQQSVFANIFSGYIARSVMEAMVLHVFCAVVLCTASWINTVPQWIQCHSTAIHPNPLTLCCEVSHTHEYFLTVCKNGIKEI